jgi:Cu/Ag efflux pump CusA
MMRRIVASSLKFRRIVVALAAGTVVIGVVQLSQQPADQLPEFGPTMVEVRTEALGLSTTEVEQLITVPLEQDLLNGIAFVDEIHSRSLPGLSSVVMLFEPGTPLLDARQVVQEKVAEAAVALPGVSAPPQMLQPYSSTSRVAAVRLSSERLTPIEVSVLARWNIAPRLLGVEGVANVSIWGFRDRQLQVLVDPEGLREAGITLQQVISATGNSLWFSPLTFLEASTPGTAGFIDTPNQRFGIRHELPIKSADDLAQIPIERDDGNGVIVDGEPMRLGDVATLVEDHQPLIGDAVFPDGEAGLMLVVEKFPDANTVEVSEGVGDALEALGPGLRGIEVDTSLFRPADDVVRSARNVTIAVAVGGVLLVLGLALLLREWRSILIATSAIAVSLAAAAIVLVLLDVTLNVMTVAGLIMALGIVIDDALADTRRIAERLAERSTERAGAPAWRSVLEASVAVRSSLLFATVIVFAIVVPGFFLDGQAGAFLPPLLRSYLLVVGVSMLVALVVTPALALLLLPRTLPASVSPPLRALGAWHGATLSRVLRHPRSAYAAIGVALVAGLAALPFLDLSGSIRLRQSHLLIRWDAEPGTSLGAMNAATSAVVDRLDALPGVEGVSAHVGRAVNSDQVVDVNSGEIWATLEGSSDRDTTLDAIDAVLGSYPDLSHRVTTYAEQRITDVLEGRDRDVVVRVYGPNQDVLAEKAEEIRAGLARIDGIDRPEVELTPTEPAIEVEVDLQRAQEFGVKPGDVRRAAAILLSGLPVGNLFEEQKVFDVIVWGEPDIRRSVEDVEQLLIDTPAGGRVRLREVASVRVVQDPTVVRHESVSRYVDVSADLAGDHDGVLADVRSAVAAVQFPLEHHAELRGASLDDDGTGSTFAAVAITAALAIFLLFQAAFTSWRLAILAVVMLPLAAVGGIVAIALGGGAIGVGAFAGLLAVLGLSARSATQVLRRFQELEHREGETFGDELVLRGTRERFTEILVSSVGTILVLVPILVAGDVAGLEVARPMAFVMIGGIVASTLLVLFVLPPLYRLHGFVARRDTVADDLIVLPETEIEVEPMSGS